MSEAFTAVSLSGAVAPPPIRVRPPADGAGFSGRSERCWSVIFGALAAVEGLSPRAAGQSPAAHGQSPAARRHPPVARRRPPMARGCPPMVWRYPHAAGGRPPIVRRHPHPIGGRPQMTHGCPHLTGGRPQTARGCPPFAGGRPHPAGGQRFFAERPHFPPKRYVSPLFTYEIRLLGQRRSGNGVRQSQPALGFARLPAGTRRSRLCAAGQFR